MGARDVIDHWGSPLAERERRYPCDDVLPDHQRALFRAVTVDAPPAVVFRWLCQLKIAPYSYDLLDNGGRRSPQHLVPGVDRLVVGERVQIFELASFVVDQHLTISVRRHALFGDVAMSYVVVPDGSGASRLVVKLVTVPAAGLAGAVLQHLLPAGDLVMMRRQLLNLKPRGRPPPPKPRRADHDAPLPHRRRGRRRRRDGGGAVARRRAALAGDVLALRGREAVAAVLRAVVVAFEDFTYTDELTSGPDDGAGVHRSGGRPPGPGRGPPAHRRATGRSTISPSSYAR